MKEDRIRTEGSDDQSAIGVCSALRRCWCSSGHHPPSRLHPRPSSDLDLDGERGGRWPLKGGAERHARERLAGRERRGEGMLEYRLQYMLGVW